MNHKTDFFPFLVILVSLASCIYRGFLHNHFESSLTHLTFKQCSIMTMQKSRTLDCVVILNALNTQCLVKRFIVKNAIQLSIKPVRCHFTLSLKQLYIFGVNKYIEPYLHIHLTSKTDLESFPVPESGCCF